MAVSSLLLSTMRCPTQRLGKLWVPCLASTVSSQPTSRFPRGIQGPGVINRLTSYKLDMNFMDFNTQTGGNALYIYILSKDPKIQQISLPRLPVILLGDQEQKPVSFWSSPPACRDSIDRAQSEKLHDLHPSLGCMNILDSYWIRAHEIPSLFPF